MTEETIEWSKSACIALVDEYRQRPELWDRSHSFYRCQRAKYASWSDLAGIFSCHIKDIRKKLESIMASYRSQRIKVKDGMSSIWFLYPYLSFLPKYVKSPNEIETVTLIPESDAATNVSGTGEDDKALIKIKEELGVQEPGVQELGVQEPGVQEPGVQEPGVQEPGVQEPGVRKRRVQEQIQKPPGNKRHYRTLKRRLVIKNSPQDRDLSKAYVDQRILEVKKMIMNNMPKPKDDCDSFGEYISSTLKKHDSKTRSLIKRAINNILFEQEISKYDDEIVESNSDELMEVHSEDID